MTYKLTEDTPWGEKDSIFKDHINGEVISDTPIPRRVISNGNFFLLRKLGVLVEVGGEDEEDKDGDYLRVVMVCAALTWTVLICAALTWAILPCSSFLVATLTKNPTTFSLSCNHL